MNMREVLEASDGIMHGHCCCKHIQKPFPRDWGTAQDKGPLSGRRSAKVAYQLVKFTPFEKRREQSKAPSRVSLLKTNKGPTTTQIVNPYNMC